MISRNSLEIPCAVLIIIGLILTFSPVLYVGATVLYYFFISDFSLLGKMFVAGCCILLISAGTFGLIKE
jgi:hypothetical protein